jgi:hypothetical protein
MSSTRAGALLCLALAVSSPVRAADEAPGVADENRVLALRAELADSKGAYLVLDATARVLRVMLEGAVLRVIPIQRMDLGTPEVLFMDRGQQVPLTSRIWTGGRLDPPPEIRRTEIDAVALEAERRAQGEAPEVAPAEEDAAALIPPLPEEAIPAPPRFRVRFAGGLSLEVTSGSTTGPGRLASALAALSDERDSLRLRIVLDPAAAGALYRSLPEESRLLVVR